MGFDPLKDIFAKLRERYPLLSKRMLEAQSLSFWEDAVGPAIAKHSRALKIEKETLYVEVEHPIWHQELQYRKHQILISLTDALKKKHGADPDAPVIKDLFFVSRKRNSGS